MSSNQSTDKLVRQFIDAIEHQYQKLSAVRYLSLMAVFLGILLGGFSLAGFFEAYLYLTPTAKISILALIACLSVAAGIYVFRSQKQRSFKNFYHSVSRQTTLPNLADALDLYFENKGTQDSLHKAAIQQNITTLSFEDVQQKLEGFVQTHPISSFFRKGLVTAIIGISIFLGFSIFQSDALQRLATPWASYTAPNPYNFSIKPGSVTVEQGSSFSPLIQFQGDVPNNITLAFKTDIEEQYRERSPEAIQGNQASFAPISLTTNGRYYIKMDGFESKKYDINVQLRPRFEQLSLHVIPPEYTGLDSTNYSYPFSQIRAYQGSTIEIEGLANKELSELFYVSSNLQDTLLVKEDSTRKNIFTIKTKVGATDTISFMMSDSAGLTNKNNFRFTVEPRKDQPPFVDIIEPSEDLNMKTAEPLSLQYEAGDDFGLSRARLHYEHQRAFTPEPETGTISLAQPTNNETQSFRWDLPNLNPKARDVITYWIEVYDNDRYSGAKKGISQKMMVTFPSTTEYMDELDTQEREVTESLENVSESFEQMQQQYDQFKKKLQQNPETNWEQKKQLEEVEKERQEIDKQVDELNKNFEEIKKEIEQSQAISPETMERYDELQKLMKEINDPELEKALEELRKSLGEMSPDQMRKALENYEFNEEQYKERIDRTLELFKSLKLNSDLEKTARALDDLAEQEKQLQESEQNSDQDLKQQQTIQNDLEELKDQLQNIDDQAPDKAQKQVKELQQQTNEQLDNIEKELQDNINKLREESSPQKSEDIKKQQQQIEKQLQQTAQQLRSAKQQLNQQQQQINRAALEYVLHSLINLSSNQEELTKETEKLPPRSAAFVEKAREEQNISSQFTMLSDSLFAISSEIPSFSNQINKKKAEVEGHLARSVNMLSERNRSNATYAQRQTLGGINELTTMITSLLDQLNNQQGGGSGGAMSMQQLMEQIKKMSGEQQQINQQIQEMINDMQGERLTRDQMERLNQLSRQQNRIRKQMQELQRRGELESGDRVLSELERMSEQMEDAINDLRGGQLDNSMIDRQQNILSRMLNAEKAIQERGKEERREATTAEEQQDRVSPDVTLEELQKRIRKMINDPNYTKFSDDYQRLIEQYFKLLQQFEN